jgi:hypothetical protein
MTHRRTSACRSAARRNPLGGAFVLAGLVGLLGIYGAPVKDAALRFGHAAEETVRRRHLPTCASVGAEAARWGTDRHFAWFRDEDGQTRACRTTS